MIKKLRVKFICIIMAAVFLTFAAAFAYLLNSTRVQQAAITTAAMEQVMQQLVAKTDGHARASIGNKMSGRDDIQQISTFGTVTFWVETELNGRVISQGLDQVDITDDTLEALISQVLAEKAPSGYLAEYELRFLLQQDGDEYILVFGDRALELHNVRELAQNLLLAGAGILAVLLGLSIFLSYLLVRPVEEAWQRQRQFMADASHELKTPLTVILANSQILLSQPEATVGQQRKWVESTAAEGSDMRALIDDMLFLAKQDAVTRPPAEDPVDFSELIWGVSLSMEPVAFERGIRLESDIRPGLTVRGDQAQLKRLTMILLDNACKYTADKKTIRVTLAAEKGMAVFSVANPGPAIPRESLPHLFERFYRVEKSRSRAEGGYGLGLSIAQSITETHHGTIAVQSEAELTTFTVRLPLGLP